jgi:gliding motility-associated-like protein
MKNLLSLLQKKSVRLLAFLIPIVTILVSSHSVTAQNQTAKMTPKSGIWYYEYLPPDYNSNTNNYPIVFFLHGLGERGDTETSLSTVARNGPPLHVKNGYKFPFILISPQLKAKYTGWPNTYIDEVIEYCRNNLRVDQSRIYLMGLSLGGGGTWGYSQDPILNQKLAAIAIACGHQNNLLKACNIVNSGIPIWAFHGDADTTVPYSKTVNMVKAVNACVPAPNPLALITIYPGVGHNCWGRAFATDHTYHNPNVYEWLLQYKNGGVKVNAGPDLALNLPTNSTNITGTATTETGSITSYTWTLVSGPTGTLTNTNTPTVTLTNLIAGIYTFRLTASNGTEIAYDDVKVTVTSANQAPVANAGNDVILTLPTNSVNLIGAGSDVDGSIASYAWAKVSGPTATMTGQTTATLSLSALLQGTYVFSLTVKDNVGATSSDQVTVTVNAAIVNQLPTANAGADKIINLPTNATNLTGSGSDPDGTIATYLWEKVSGPTVTISNPGSTTVSLSALLEGTYSFRLTVKDDKGATATDQVTVTVIAANQSPIANAGVDIILTQPTSTTNIIGSANDPDGSIAVHSWAQVGVTPQVATFTNASNPTATVSNLMAPGVYTFRLTVTDDDGSTGFDDVKVTVNAAPVNVIPVANAGADKSIILPNNSVIFTGTGTDSDGSITGYNWIKVSGPTATLTNQSTPSLTASDLVAGSYIFRLTVTDNQTATNFDEVSLIVQPAPVNLTPVASAGGDIVLTLPANSTTLTGSGNDSDGIIASYLWTKVSGPTATLTGDATASLDLTNLVAGSYVFQLVVTDDKGASDTDDVLVTVNAANVPPTANAGGDISITLPIEATSITGSGADSDGTIASYLWSEVSSPTTPTLTDETTPILSVSGLSVAGTYIFRLTVTDDDGDTGTDDVKVIVNAAANQAPTANAGANKIITLPTNTANFTGTAADTDGTIASYAWTQTGGPAIITLTNANSPTLTVGDIAIDGTYTFTLTVFDNSGASGFDEVTLQVNPAIIKIPPTVSAGGNQSITLPLNSLTLTGSGSDTDGSIAIYKWTLVSGPTATLTNANTPDLSLSNLIEGNYTFRLTVTDNDGLTAFAQVSVTVLPAAVNQPPVANAGADLILTLPVDNTTLFGSGSDADGTVITYDWVMLSSLTATLTNTTSANLSLSGLAQGIHTFQLTVTDEKGATATDNVTVTVNAIATNQAPIANAGANKTIKIPTNALILKGTGSDADGTVVSYAWVKVSGPTVTLGVLNQANLSLSNLVPGIYVFRLEVTDDDGATATDDVKVTVNPETLNQPPTVTAQNDIQLFLPDVATTSTTTTVSGSASDADGTIVLYTWTQVSGPNTATLLNASTTVLTASDLIAGIYNFRLTVKDDKSATAFDEVKVTVNAATVNQPPSINGGADVVIKLPTANTTLTASGSDPEGGVVSYHWEQVSGPSTLSFTDANPLVLNSMVEGTYEFQVTITDDKTATATDFVLVTVLPAALNLAPVANAGGDISIQLPESSATITGSFTDDDDTNASVLWTQASGPIGSTATLNGTLTNDLSVSDLKEGTYVFRITVNDNDPTSPLSDFDEVTVLVLPADIPNPPPFVFVEGDSLLELPDNAITLTAVAGSPNGLIQSYKWEQIFGSPIVIENDSTNILEVSNLTLGTFAFKVTVTDEAGQEAFDDFIVEVKAGPSNAFSPNNDGRYDTWSIGDASAFTDCEVNVYNRQGSKVYHSINYISEWDGTFNGKPLPEGVYFYVIRCSSQKPKTGSVTIIR